MKKSNKKPAPPVCFWCEKKKAKVIPSIYECATKEAVFCSKNCAVNFALVEFNERDDQNVHWCPSRKSWEHSCGSQCEACHQQPQEEK